MRHTKQQVDKYVELICCGFLQRQFLHSQELEIVDISKLLKNSTHNYKAQMLPKS